MTSHLPARRSTITGVLVGGYCGAVVLVPSTSAKLILAVPLLIGPIVWWTLCEPNRWLLAFIAAAWLFPPLPFDIGSGGPHVALLFAAIGAFAAVLTFVDWRVKIDLLAGTLLVLLGALLVSCVPAFTYSGAEVGAGALARVVLFSVSVFTFFFVRDGPFQADVISSTALVRVIFWAAVGSTLFACVDFYFQLLAAPGHSVQFVWLDSGMYRRAQGVFYESSTLGNMSVFVLVMIITACLQHGIQVVPRWLLLTGAVPVVIALLMSYSRGSLVSLGVALVCLVGLKVRWARWKQSIGIALLALAGSGTAAFVLSPAFARVAWLRMFTSVQYFWTAPDAVLSGRLTNWVILIDYVIQEPWKIVAGVGYKTLSISGIYGAPVIADNTYLSALIETGIVGLVALITLNAVILTRSYRASRSKEPHRSFLGTWVFCFWMGETVQMLSGDLLSYWRVLPVFLCIVALAEREAA